MLATRLASCKTLANLNSDQKPICVYERRTSAFEDLLAAAGFVTHSITPLYGDALVAIESKEDK